MLDVAETEVANEIADMEKRAYHLWVSYFDQLGQYKQGSTDSDDRGKSNTTKRSGIRSHCRRIYNFPEVKAVYLMSGGYDFMVMLEGKTMKEISMFTSSKLAPLESVVSTVTHFVLKKYKDHGTVLEAKKVDERQAVTP